MLQYGTTELLPLRDAIANWVKVGIETSPDQVLVLSGSSRGSI